MLRRLFRACIPSSLVTHLYLKAGEIVGDAVSYSYMGEAVGFRENFEKWATWEREYSKRGFRTLSLDDFIVYGGMGKPIDHLIAVKRTPHEEPIFHAEIYRREYLGKIQPALDLDLLVNHGVPQTGIYAVPSTENQYVTIDIDPEEK